MAVRSSANRYQNYGLYPSGDSYGTASSSVQCSSREASPRPNLVDVNDDDSRYQREAEAQGHPSASSRLEYIINAMAYIRGELDDLKESDRVLLDIFKQLENNVSELSDSISTWKVKSPGRPTSFTDLDFDTSRSSYCDNSLHSLETILDTSKEDIYKESDPLYLPEDESSSSSCSPVLPSLKSHSSVLSVSGASGGSSKRSADPSPQPQLRKSTSYTSRLASSPSITRLQDETGSNISRNSSIDSGIQFASEAENGSGNGVEPMQLPASETAEVETNTETEANDVRKSVGFADDIFSVLGMK